MSQGQLHREMGVGNIEATDDLTVRQEIYGEVQKAYGYLTNPLTKIIYDEYGVSGLIVYEKSKKDF